MRGNLSITYKQYKKSLEKIDIKDIKVGLVRIDLLLFILVICIFENDEGVKNIMGTCILSSIENDIKIKKNT